MNEIDPQSSTEQPEPSIIATGPTEIDTAVMTAAPRRGRWFTKFLILCFFIAGLAVAGVFYLSSPSQQFPINSPVTITPGENARQISQTLAEAGVVRSSAVLYFVLTTLHNPNDIKAGTYEFSAPITTFAVATELTEGNYQKELVRLTHIEGERAEFLAERAAEVLTDFSAEEFIVLALPHEGKLFPETYFIPPTFTPAELLTLLLETYQTETASLAPAVATSEYDETQILILASILEREANDETSMKMVAGIYNNRLRIGMPLQADATIEYVLDTPLNELPPGQLAEELRRLDSPYNSYLNPGLPPTPIGNPGLGAITAVMQPTPSDYFYYITDNDGNFHYARTLDEHNANIARYLR